MLEHENETIQLLAISPFNSRREQFENWVTDPLKVDDRFEAIEKEIAELKIQLSHSKDLKVVKLKGVLKGLRVDESMVKQAKRSLFKHASS